MTVNDINSSLISAIELLAKKYDNELQTTLTIEATITATLNSTTGAYTVDYMGSKFTAYANNPDITYVVDDKVYILVPNGDFTKEKIILGYPASAADDETSTIQQVTEEASGDILDCPIGLSFCTYDKENLSKDRRVYKVELPNPSLYKSVIQGYFDTYNRFKFSCKIKNDIYPEADSTTRRINGNYGITINIKYWPFEELTRTEETLVTSSTTIDVNNILGNPYDQPIYSTQELVIEDIPEGATIATQYDDCITIEYFVEDFSQILPDEDGYDEDGVLKDDLFIKDIALKALNVLTTDKLKGYSLQITGSNGDYLTTNSSTYSYKDDSGITYTISKEEYDELSDEAKKLYHSKYEKTVLKLDLKKKGKSLQIGSAPIYWFKEDNSVTTTDNTNYSSYGGLGWKILNTVKNAESSIYNTNKQTFTAKLDTTEVDWEDTVVSSTRYKCVIIYDSQKISSTITIHNMDCTYSIKIESVTGSNKVIAGSGTAHLRCNVVKGDGTVLDSENYTFSWSRYNSSGSYIGSVEATDVKNEIKIPAIYINELNKVVCTVYESTKYIGSAEFYVITDDAVDLVIALQNSDVLYKYDSDGDAPTSSRYDGKAGAAITSISPLLLEVRRVDGVELIEEEYRRMKVTWKLPVESLMEFDEAYTSTLSSDGKYYIYETDGYSSHKAGITYTLVNSYNANKSNNTIVVSIDFDDTKANYSKTIMFLKDGEDGTNGSSYSAVITYEGIAGKVVTKDGTPHRLQIYTDGKSYKYISYTANRLLDFYDESKASTDTDAVKKASRLVLNTPGGIDVSVYYNGEDITQEEDEDYTVYSWGMANSGTNDKMLLKVVKDKDNDYYYLALNDKFDGNSYCCILQAKIKLGNRSYIYAYYPIDIIRVDSFTDARYYYLYGYNSVMYASDGGSPKYSNGNYFEFYKYQNNTSTLLSLNISTKDYCTIPENSCLKISRRSVDTDEEGNDTTKTYVYRVKPNSTFNGESNNYINFTTGDIHYIASIYCYYDTSGYGNMIIWDGTNIKVDGDAKIISSQVLSGVSGDTGFTGITIGQTSSESSSDNNKNGLLAFKNGSQTAYISADTGAVYLGPNNEIALAVPVANTDNEVTNTIAGWNVTDDRFYDNNGSTQSAMMYSANAKQTSSYKVTPNADATSHMAAFRTNNSSAGHKTIISYDGSLYSDYGNIGGWIIGNGTLTSQDGSMVLNSANGTITGIPAPDLSSILTRLQEAETLITQLTARIEALEEQEEEATPSEPEETPGTSDGGDTTEPSGTESSGEEGSTESAEEETT